MNQWPFETYWEGGIFFMSNGQNSLLLNSGTQQAKAIKLEI